MKNKLRAIWAILWSKGYIVVTNIRVDLGKSTIFNAYTKDVQFMNPHVILEKLADMMEQEAKDRGAWVSHEVAEKLLKESK